MELNYGQIFRKELNQIYKEMKRSKDYPYNLDELKFLKTYADLTNYYELELFDQILNRVNNSLNADYSIYANETHYFFNDSYLNYQGTYQVLLKLQHQLKRPVIDYSVEDQTILSLLITKQVDDSIGYLNYKYKELFLQLKNYKLIRMIQDEFKEVLTEKHSFAELITLMCEFNIETSKFYEEIKTKTNNDKRLSNFLYDLKKTFYLFKPFLSIYFKLSIINHCDDDIIVKYSSSYITK
ncbi:hypothetical protein [Mesoplasma lactucae]|uniref:Uncharacterized protein n=1 Tax=Mesoplasma lactucae ATCC 49193 TaxID=81460 RepID=A0A291ISB3_9MOLU|nr:hypothetical protein [Mesoplasma lactucae]ATG97772.1 hypothetical protein CP520_03480 [Mesoplasma lactucae ATCC 49193]ATZ20451.1 hypothetical protein MLACT_v1c06300 [Mesoplasma lactucae ATCC 49193]MCL8216623.1 hypothetical protein [Mesoplasma lactucae ATCC 49193]